MATLTAGLICLALNIYNESRGESIPGQFAVGYVTMARVESNKWPDTICEVVYQHKQFSWTLQKFSVTEEERLNMAVEIAENVIEDYDGRLCPDHFYNPSVVTPKWANDMNYMFTIGNHKFYCSEEE